MADQPHVVVEEPRSNLVSNAIAIIGLIVLIVIVIWGLVHLAGLSRGWFGNLFGRSGSIVVTAPKDATSGQAFTVSWKHSTSESGNYAFLFQCREGLTLKFGSSAGISIPCGAGFTVGATTSLSIYPALSGAASTTVPLSVIFLPSATSSQQVQGSASVTVHNAVATPEPEPETPASPTPATPTTPKPASGPADITVRMIAIGVIDPGTGTFVNRMPAPQDIAAAQFDIANVGGSASGTYYFTAVLPTASPYTYVSQGQASLSPGDHVVNTLRWTQSHPAGGNFSVTISGSNDSNTSNNYASQWLGFRY